MESGNRVVVKRPGRPASIELIQPGLESLQKIVAGYIELVMVRSSFFDDGGDLVVYGNDEAALNGMAVNVFRPDDGHPLRGPIVFVKNNADGDDVSMSYDEAQHTWLALASAMRQGEAP